MVTPTPKIITKREDTSVLQISSMEDLKEQPIHLVNGRLLSIYQMSIMQKVMRKLGNQSQDNSITIIIYRVWGWL